MVVIGDVNQSQYYHNNDHMAFKTHFTVTSNIWSCVCRVSYSGGEGISPPSSSPTPPPRF